MKEFRLIIVLLAALFSGAALSAADIDRMTIPARGVYVLDLFTPFPTIE